MNRYDIALGKDPPEREEKLPPQPIEESPKKEKGDTRGLIELLRSAGGRQRLAESMAQPLRQRLDYGSVARRALRVDSLHDGALPIYDQYRGALAVDESGQGIITLPGFSSGTNSAIIPLFEVSSNPTISLVQLQERRFDLIERVQDHASVQIRQTEDSLFVRLLNSISTPNILSGPLTRDIIAESFHSIEQYDLRVNSLFMNLRSYETVNRTCNDLIDHVGQRDLIQQGLIGSLWGAQIVLSESIPQGEIYAMAEPEFVGVLPVRTDLIVLSSDSPEQRTVGWTCFENIGMACCNPNAVLRITANPQTGRVEYSDSSMAPSSFISGSRNR